MNRAQLRAVPSQPAEHKTLTNEQRKKRIASLRKSLMYIENEVLKERGRG